MVSHDNFVHASEYGDVSSIAQLISANEVHFTLIHEA